MQVLYVSGMPGTGKTASVLEAVRQLREAARGGGGTPFALAHVNLGVLELHTADLVQVAQAAARAAEVAQVLSRVDSVT